MYNATDKITTTVHEYRAVKAQISQLHKAVATDHLDTAALKKDFDADVLGMLHGALYEHTVLCEVILGSQCESTTESHF